MILCLDIGNTHIYGGLFIEHEIGLRFRYPSSHLCTSDTLGLFLRNVLRENDFVPDAVEAISICSVVPSLDYTVNSACRKYFKLTPIALKPGTKTGVKLAIKNPIELGADRLANAVAALAKYPDKNIIIADFGTATTLCALSTKKEYLGGAILPGLKLMMGSLSQNAAKLSAVDIVKPDTALGKTTATNIQAGLYYSQLGAIKEIIRELKQETFSGQDVTLISTGGYAHLFRSENIFDDNIPDLVLDGLYLVWQKNLRL